MNILERQILSDIDNIETVTLEAEYNVLSTLIDCYNKQSMIMEYYKGDDITEFSIFQEGFSDIINTAKGDSSENLFLRIIKFIPRLIGAIVKAIKNFFNKNKEDETLKMLEKNTEQIIKLRESIKQDIDDGKTSVDEICREYAKKHGGFAGPKSDTLYRIKAFIDHGWIPVDAGLYEVDLNDIQEYLEKLGNIIASGVYNKQTTTELRKLQSIKLRDSIAGVESSPQKIYAKELRQQPLDSGKEILSDTKGLLNVSEDLLKKIDRLLHSRKGLIEQFQSGTDDEFDDLREEFHDVMKCLRTIVEYINKVLLDFGGSLDIIRFLNTRDRFINQKKNSTEYRLRQSEKELRKANSEMNATKKKAMSNIANRHAMAGKIMSDAYKDIMAPLDPIDNEPINDDSGIPSKNQSELDKMSKELDDILNGL